MKLTDQEIERLRDILEWWDKNHQQGDHKIRFDHSDSRTYSVRLGRAFYEKVDLMARLNPNYRSFSRMVEMLLWDAVGRPEEFIVKPQKADTGD